MSHDSPAQRTDTWLTPLPIIRALGAFDMDPCGLAHWPTARRIVQLPEDGLRMTWEGRIWLNPPYGTQQWPWLAKLACHGHGTALIFARTETEGFRAEVWGKAAAVRFMHGRIRFHFANGRQAKVNAGAPSVLVAYGELDARRLAAADIEGTFIDNWSRQKPSAAQDSLDFAEGC